MLSDFINKLIYPRKKRAQTASIAKERLQIVVSHHRKSKNLPDFVTHLEKDILNVLKKYVEVDADMVKVNLEQNRNESKLELNVTLPQNTHEHETS
ncbi:cell division topological specificity factor MinE [Gammaproteobacteria bacterium]|nr:cell division topological specificity factor MinE [Gammaproteobacteria bacterium]